MTRALNLLSVSYFSFFFHLCLPKFFAQLARAKKNLVVTIYDLLAKPPIMSGIQLDLD